MTTENRWTGGLCPAHGAFPKLDCPECPPNDHPIQVSEMERKRRVVESLAHGLCPYCHSEDCGRSQGQTYGCSKLLGL